MDALSRLLILYPMRTALERHSQVGAPWLIAQPQAAAGTAPFHLVTGGGAWLSTDGDAAIELQAGDVLLLPHGGAHRLHAGDAARATALRVRSGHSLLDLVGNSGDGPVTNLLSGAFYFQEGAASALLACLPARLLVRSAGRTECASLRTLVNLLKGEADAMRPGAGAIAPQLASALFALLIRAWLELEQAPAAPGLFALLAERRLQAVMQGMLEAPHQSWSLKDMAAACHMSRATFARLFHQVGGATPATVLMQTRMAQAACWLAQGAAPVSAIGEAVGYQSEAAFSRVFKRCYGIGPGQFRRNAKAGIGPLVRQHAPPEAAAA